MKHLYRSLLLSSLSASVIAFMLPGYATTLALTPVQITGMFSVGSLFALLSKPIAGKLCDRFGKRVVCLCGFCFTALSCLLLAFSQGLFLLYLARALSGIAAALLSVAVYLLLADQDSDELTVNLGKQAAAENRGGWCGLLIFIVLMSLVGFQQGWKFFFILCALGAVLAVWISRDIPCGNTPASPSEPLLKRLTPHVTHLIAVRFCFSLGLNVLWVTIVLILHQRFESNSQAAMLIYFIPLWILNWLMPRTGAAVKKLGEKRAFVFAGATTPVLLFLLAQCDGLLFFGLLWFGYRVAVTAMRLALDALFSRETEGQGALGGVYSFSNQLGSIISSIFGGVLLQLLGEHAPFYAAAVMLAVSVVVFRVVPRAAAAN